MSAHSDQSHSQTFLAGDGIPQLPHTPPETASIDGALSGVTPRTPSPPNDLNSTPPKAGASSARNAVNPPKGKSAGPILSVPNGMRSEMEEVSVETMFYKYIPGDDPSPETLEQFYYTPEPKPGDAVPAPRTPSGGDSKPKAVQKLTEWYCDIEICKIAKSVVDYAPPIKDVSGPRFLTRETCHWPVQAVQGRKKRKRSAEATVGEDDVGSKGTRPDAGIYLDNERTKAYVLMPEDEFLEKSSVSDADKQARKNWVGFTSWADLLVPIEVKVDHGRSAFTYTPGYSHFVHDTKEGIESLGQILGYVGQVFTHQHRTHVYALYIFKFQARILYFDRSGCIVSKSFEYGTKSETTLHRFFWRLARMSTEERGFDPTAELASETEIDQMIAYAPHAPTDYIEQQIYHALCWDRGTNGYTSSQWPAYKLKVDGRTVLVGRPIDSSVSLHGRCTRAYLAYDPENHTTHLLKDSWRPNIAGIRPEHEHYKRLSENGVSHVLTCEASQDVPDSLGGCQVTKTHAANGQKLRTQRGHYRMLLREVCRRLIDFKDFQELASLLADAMSAHEEAWYKAKILHRDISVNNILILEKGRGKDVTRSGILSDWDLCKYKEQMNPKTKIRQPNITGTWYFRSALSLRFPQKPYRLSDDIESFVHIFHFLVHRFHITDDTAQLKAIIQATYGREDLVEGVSVGGFGKIKFMRSSDSPVLLMENFTLLQLLSDMAEIYSRHYRAINLIDYAKAYTPGFAGTNEEQKAILQERLSKATTSQPLDTHDKLKELFLRYGGRLDDESSCVSWPTKDLTKSEDLFVKAGLAAERNAQLSSSRGGVYERRKARGGKRRRGDEGSVLALPSVEESQQEDE